MAAVKKEAKAITKKKITKKAAPKKKAEEAKEEAANAGDKEDAKKAASA